MSTKNIGIDAGAGIKTWSVALPAAFYDLVKVSYDTFTVYAYGVDQVNYPDATYANIGSSLTAISTYYFQSSPPTAAVAWPPAGTAQSAVSSVTVTVGALGSGIKQVWAAFIDTTTLPNGKYWDGHAWQNLGGHDPGNINDAVWLSTDSATGPDMVYTPFMTQTSSNIVFTGVTDISSPAWVDGTVDKIYVRAVNGTGQVVNTYPGAYQFVYDHTAPVVTMSTSITQWGTTPGNATWLNSLPIASGTITDNIYDALNQRHVYVRIADVTGAQPV